MKHVGIDNSMFPGATILIGHELHIASVSGGIWIGTHDNYLFICKSGVRHNGILLAKDAMLEALKEVMGEAPVSFSLRSQDGSLTVSLAGEVRINGVLIGCDPAMLPRALSFVVQSISPVLDDWMMKAGIAQPCLTTGETERTPK